MGEGQGAGRRRELGYRARGRKGEREGTKRLFLENQSRYKNGQKGERTRIIYLLALC